MGFAAIYYAIYAKKLDYKVLFKKYYALYFFIGSVFFQLLVFTPIGIERKGATRWLDAGFTTLQPSEFLKITLVLFLASLLVGFKKELKKFKCTLIILGSTVGVVSLLMLLIRDKGTLIIASLAVLGMLVISKVNKQHILILSVGSILSLGLLIGLSGSESYAKDRVLSFLGLIESPQGQNYQINQAIATIGSGQVIGKGYGQSVQKHKYLPETLNDSIFAVFAEEWGFVGSTLLVLLFTAFAWFGFSVARGAREDYGRYVAIGLTILIVAQAYFNIAALLKLVPLSGMPLIFISKGGSSVLASLLMVAILLNISRYTKTPK